MVFYVELVFYKVRCKNHHLITRIEERLQDDVQATSRPNHHNNMVGRKGHASLTRQLGSNSGPGLGIAHIGHIAVHAGLRMCHELMQGFIELGWRLQHRVTQRKIVDVVSAILLLELDPLLEHATYPGRGLHVLTHALGYGHMDCSLLRHENTALPLLQACVKSTLHASQKIVLGTKFTLTREGSNFNVFDPFKYLVRFIKHQKTTVLMEDYHTGGDIPQ